MSNETNLPIVSASFDRRGFFRIGGLTIARPRSLAACGDDSSAGELGRVGTGAAQPTLLDPSSTTVSCCAPRRPSRPRSPTPISTSSTPAISRGQLTFPDIGDQSEMVKRLPDQHRKAAESFNALAQEAGAEPWTCGNPRLDSAFIQPIFDRVENGAAATDTLRRSRPATIRSATW